MSLGHEQETFSRHLTALLRYIFTAGCEVRIGEVQRPLEMQQLYVKQGRSKTMKSNHILKCAADLFIFKDGKWLTGRELQPFGDFWESLDPGKNRWGGNWKSFKDEPHFERNLG